MSTNELFCGCGILRARVQGNILTVYDDKGRRIASALSADEDDKGTGFFCRVCGASWNILYTDSGGWDVSANPTRPSSQ